MNKCVDFYCEKNYLYIFVSGELTSTVMVLCFNAVYEILIVKIINIFQVPEVPKKVVQEEVSVKVPKKPEPPPAKGNCCTQWIKEKLFVV